MLQIYLIYYFVIFCTFSNLVNAQFKLSFPNKLLNLTIKKIKNVPVDWADTKIIKAHPGEYIIIARKDKNSGDWYLGAFNDENPRTFIIKTDFLSPNIKFKTGFYQDTKEAHLQTNPACYSIDYKLIKKNNFISLSLAPSRGCAI